jgi:polyhydroxybutyrate depolymerase
MTPGPARRRVILAGLVVTALGLHLAATDVTLGSPGDQTRTLRVGGRTRSYLLHVPPRLPSGPRPLVLVFHGGASNANATVRLTGLSDKADAEGFLVAYPSGTGRLPLVLTWNAGACCGYAVDEHVDDVAFVLALLDDITTVTRIDQGAIFATGISNGGQMAYRLAAERPDRIAAIAPVAGSLEVPLGYLPHPVSVLHFHGTDDDHLPFDGGRGRRSIAGVSFSSVAHTIGSWVAADHCRPTPDVTPLPDRVDDGTTVERREYPRCQEGAAVVLYVIQGGGHTWPGRPALAGLLGVTTREISATDLMWDFFVSRRRTSR